MKLKMFDMYIRSMALTIWIQTYAHELCIHTYVENVVGVIRVMSEHINIIQIA